VPKAAEIDRKKYSLAVGDQAVGGGENEKVKCVSRLLRRIF